MCVCVFLNPNMFAACFDFKPMYSFLAQPNALTHLDLSSTECALDMVMAFYCLEGSEGFLTDRRPSDPAPDTLPCPPGVRGSAPRLPAVPGRAQPLPDRLLSPVGPRAVGAFFQGNVSHCGHSGNGRIFLGREGDGLKSPFSKNTRPGQVRCPSLSPASDALVRESGLRELSEDGVSPGTGALAQAGLHGWLSFSDILPLINLISLRIFRLFSFKKNRLFICFREEGKGRKG